MLGMSGGSNFTDRTDIPPTMNVNMSKVMTFKAGFLVVRVGMRKRGVDGFAVNGSGSLNLMTKFYALNGKFCFWR